MLKSILDSLDGLNPAIAAEYTKDPNDGKFYLQAEGMVLKNKADGKLQQANETNSRLSKELDELRKSAETKVEKKEVERLQKMLDEMEQGKGGEKFKAVLEREIAAYKLASEENLKTAKTQYETEKAAREKAETDLKDYRIKQSVHTAASEVGLKSKAAKGYLELACRDFDIHNGEVVAVKRTKDPQTGKEVVTPLMGENYEPMKLSDYIAKNHRSNSPHLEVFFDTGSGSGAPGNTNTNNTGNGFRISREDAQNPEKYQRVREAALKAGQQPQIEPPRPGQT